MKRAGRVGALLGFVMLVTTGCVTSYSDRHITYCMEQSLISARELVEQGRKEEAYQIVAAMQKADPAYPGLAEVKTTCAPAEDHAQTVSFLGENVRKRAEVNRGLPAKICLYLPDRVLDFLDIVSFDIHFGGGLMANMHATRAIQAGAGLRSVGGIGWHDNRSLGIESQKEADLSVLAFGSDACSLMRVGTSGMQDVSDSILGIHKPGDPLYQEYRDYWAVGASVTALFIGIDVDVHPVQIADFFCGLVCFDLSNDDFARTRPLKLNDLDRRLLTDLSRIRKYKESLRNTAPSPKIETDGMTEGEPEASAKETKPTDIKPEEHAEPSHTDPDP